MEVKNYFIAALGKIEGIKDDLLVIASNQPKYIDSKNVLLCTFKSPFNITEIKLLIEQIEGRVYFISEIKDSTFDYFIPNQMHKDLLFGEFEETVNDITHEEVKEKEEEVENNEMSVLDLIDKGYENLTDEEKEFLNKNR